MRLILLLSFCLPKAHSKEAVLLELKGGFPDGFYTLDLFLGLPPQKQRLIVDTGSNLMVVKCQEGTNFFDFRKSGSYQLVNRNTRFKGWKCANVEGDQCRFKIRYEEGSYYSGVLAMDSVSFGGSGGKLEAQFVFGCATESAGLLETPTS